MLGEVLNEEDVGKDRLLMRLVPELKCAQFRYHFQALLSSYEVNHLSCQGPNYQVVVLSAEVQTLQDLKDLFGERVLFAML